MVGNLDSGQSGALTVGTAPSLVCGLSQRREGTEEGGFITSGAMLHFVKESILTTNLNKAGKTIVLLVVLAINLLCRGKSDASMTSSVG